MRQINALNYGFSALGREREREGINANTVILISKIPQYAAGTVVIKYCKSCIIAFNYPAYRCPTYQRRTTDFKKDDKGQRSS
jgi:hypothetical protein